MTEGQERVYQAAVDAFILDRNKWQAEAERLRAENERLRDTMKALLEIDEVKYSSNGAVFVASSLVQDS
jgi:hypothetical protein